MFEKATCTMCGGIAEMSGTVVWPANSFVKSYGLCLNCMLGSTMKDVIDEISV